MKEKDIPKMDILALQTRLQRCTETHKNSFRCNICRNCEYYGASDCKDRLMLDAAHALYLIAQEKESENEN